MNSIKMIAACLSALLVSLGDASPWLSYGSGTAPSYDHDGPFHLNIMLYIDYYFQDGFMVSGSSSATLDSDADPISALLIPPGSYAQVWEQGVNDGPTELFPPGY